MEVERPLELQRYFEIICTAHTFFILTAIETLGEPLSVPEITKGISKITRGAINLQDQQTRIPTQSLAKNGLLMEVPSYYGKRKISKYELTQKGEKYLNAIKQFLEALE